MSSFPMKVNLLLLFSIAVSTAHKVQIELKKIFPLFPAYIEPVSSLQVNTAHNSC